MKKTFDPITQTATLAFVVLVICAVISTISIKKNTKNWYIIMGTTFVVGGIAVAIRGYFAAKQPALILDNEYTGAGCFKCESETDCIIKDLRLLDEKQPIDGIKTGLHPDKVYKMRNGTHARITKEGDVKEYSFVSRWVNPGWKDKKFFEGEGALGQWNPLFDCQS